LMLPELPVFPCSLDKKPLIAGGFKSARRGATEEGWPLVGFATGAASGVDVLDVDPTGNDWYGANFNALPQTRAHQTQRGLHLLFRHAAGLRCSTSRIAPGVDVRADGGYAIWWPRQGLAFKDWPICEWPDWLLREARGKDAVSPERDLTTSTFIHHTSIQHCDGASEALFKLDPVRWRNSDGSAEGYQGWLRLMMACKAVGISADDFVRWSTQDADYAGHGDEIRRKWDSVRQRHGGALWVALKQAGIKLNGRDREGFVSGEEPLPASPSRSRSRLTKTRNWRSRLECACNKFVAEPSEPMLFWLACVFAEVMAECNRPAPSVAMKLLEEAAKESGLWRQLGADEVRRTIANGLRHVEEKVLDMPLAGVGR
jgi:Bifunctional DNA primase/polymerase, N-terminal/Primase C terminal 2 (PriCT-2)